jgi:tetratricopeptide (TPR) repeat protein
VRRLRLAALAVSAAACAACRAPRAEDGYVPRPPGTLTFAGHVAPILYERCTPCHRSGGPAPFPLETYQDVKNTAALIAPAVAAGSMPPWLPAPGAGEFSGERRLTPTERGMLLQWVDEGAPPGDLGAAPPPPRWPDGWTLGEPDLALTLSPAYLVPPGGGDLFRNFVLPVSLPAARWVRAVELDPGNSRVVHHAMIMVDTSRLSRAMDAEDPEPGFGGMHTGRHAQMPPGFFLGWTPGRLPVSGSPDLSWALPAGADLVLMLHLRPTAQPETVQARVGLHFADAPPRRLATTVRLGVEHLDIPAGASSYAASDSLVLPVDLDVLGIYPHAHYLGRDLRVYARLPGGGTQWLLHIPDWNFSWQDEFTYARALSLPRGSTVVMEYRYDNTAANPRNPNRPPVRVRFGPRSTDEMGDAWLRVVPRDSADLSALHRELAARGLARRLQGLEQAVATQPEDAAARLDLAALLVAAGRESEAVSHYQRAIALRPEDGQVRLALAALLHRLGRLAEAASHYREAARLVADPADAYNNLGNVLLALGDVAAAIPQYRLALLAAPGHARAHNNLGIALVAAGKVSEALPHMRQAARLAPDWPVPLASLAWTLATHPEPQVRRPDEAVRLAARAAELTARRDPDVLRTLAAAYAAAGRFEAATESAERALELARAASAGAEQLGLIVTMLRHFRESRAFVDPLGTVPPRAP